MRYNLGLFGGILIALVMSLLIFGQPSASSNTKFPSAQATHHDIIVINPTFTTAAYQHRGFYDYYRHNCNTKCLTVSLHPSHITETMKYSGSSNAITILKSHDVADIIPDEQVSLHPSILKSYRKVVILHNEYVTQTEFDAIRHHPNVLYLYPNSLYARVTYDTKDDTITLQKGHGYKGVNHAFHWGPAKTTKYEYDSSCKDWHLKRVINGYMLQCYPESRILFDKKLWAAIEK